MSRLELLRPKLKPCSTVDSDRHLVVECTKSREPLVLSRAAKPILPLLDGTRSIQQIVDQLHRQQGHVKFHVLFSTIERLAAAGFLDSGAPPPADASSGVPKNISEKQPLLFRRILLKVMLSQKIGAGRERLPLFVALALGILAAGLGFVVFGADSHTGDWIPNDFLRVRGSYVNGLWFFPLAASLLMTLRQLCHAGLLLLATGRIYGLSLALTPISLSLRVEDTSIHLARPRWAPILLHLASPAAYLAIAGGIASLAPTSTPGVRTLMMIAVFLAFQELSPYARSSLTRLLAECVGEPALAHFGPYMRNRSLLSFAALKPRLPGERTLIAYSAVAVVWSSLFFSFVACVAARNFPGLAQAIGGGGPVADAGAALFILAAIGAFLGFLAFDLVRTIVGNLFFPLTSLFAVARRSTARRKEAKPKDDTILRALHSTALFQGASGATLDRLVNSCLIRTYGNGIPLLIQGQPNQMLFILLSGSAFVARRAPSGTRTRLAVLETGAVFGEISALEGSPATADVVTQGRCRVLEIPRASLRATAKDKNTSPDLERISAKVLLGQCIASSPLFKEMPAEVANFLSTRGVLKTAPAGTAVTQQGEEDRTLYLLVRGRASVQRDGQPVGEIKQGEFFGEIALLAGVPRTASVITAEESVLLSIHADDVWSVLAKNPGLSLFMETVAEARRAPVAEAA